MSVLNVYSTDLDTERRHYRSSISVSDHRIASLYRRFSWSHHQPSSTGSYYDTFSSSSSSSRNSSLEGIFSRLLDVLIFTSAMAITAYNYLTGTLDAPPSHFIVEAPPIKPNTLDYNKRHNSKRGREIMILHDPIEESRRQRTQQWAEQQLYPHHHHHHHHHQKKRHSAPAALDKKVQQSPKSNSKREKKRTQSLSNKPAEKEEDEMFSRMEERLQSLIEQGQAALTSQIDFDDQIVSNKKR